ncbi:MAG: RNA polymerase sigma factor [Candidatus Moranbacteria bacterium]|nr:RNA polymerase sigma factor [Candidatus Moranbacteria bacterium]MDD3965299.1 RNA polymerase sigma factor [Candidatus Moranbacteria bacterium]
MRKEILEKKFHLLYDNQSDALFRFVSFRVNDREMALDIVQNTFLKMWEVLESGRAIENERAFLFRIASNLVIDYYRKSKEYSLDSLAEEGFDAPSDPGIPIETQIDADGALACLQSLSEKYREPVWLRTVEDWSVKDIAEVLNETENVVSVRIHRGLKLWRSEIGKKNGKKSASETSRKYV